VRWIAFAVALWLAGCGTCGETAAVELRDASPEDACACTDPWRCEWYEAGVSVGPGDCIFCLQVDGGGYICMNPPAVPP